MNYLLLLLTPQDYDIKLYEWFFAGYLVLGFLCKITDKSRYGECFYRGGEEGGNRKSFGRNIRGRESEFKSTV